MKYRLCMLLKCLSNILNMIRWIIYGNYSNIFDYELSSVNEILVQLVTTLIQILLNL